MFMCMTSHNPYAPSAAALKAGTVAARCEGVKRDGKWIVMPVGGDLPPRCVKCNATADEPTKQRKVQWHHPAIYLVLLFNIIVYAIVAAIVSKRIKVSPGLCEQHKARRRNAILYAWLGIVGSIVLPIVFGSEEYAGEWIFFCIVLFLGSCVMGIVRSRVLYAKKIDDYSARLGGAGPQFLDSLPE